MVKKMLMIMVVAAGSLAAPRPALAPRPAPPAASSVVPLLGRSGKSSGTPEFPYEQFTPYAMSLAVSTSLRTRILS